MKYGKIVDLVRVCLLVILAAATVLPFRMAIDVVCNASIESIVVRCGYELESASCGEIVSRGLDARSSTEWSVRQVFWFSDHVEIQSTDSDSARMMIDPDERVVRSRSRSVVALWRNQGGSVVLAFACVLVWISIGRRVLVRLRG